MADVAAPVGQSGGGGEQSPLLPPTAGSDGNTSERGDAPRTQIERSVSWVLLSFLILGEIAGQGVFALPLHLGRLGWL